MTVAVRSGGQVPQVDQASGESAVGQGVADLGADDILEGQHEAVGRGGTTADRRVLYDAWGTWPTAAGPTRYVEAPEGSPRRYETMCALMRKDLS